MCALEVKHNLQKGTGHWVHMNQERMLVFKETREDCQTDTENFGQSKPMLNLQLSLLRSPGTVLLDLRDLEK